MGDSPRRSAPTTVSSNGIASTVWSLKASLTRVSSAVSPILFAMTNTLP